MAELAPGTEIAGCRIEAVTGRGGMGVIYRATDLRLHRPVALKLIAADRARDESFRVRFERESRLTAAIEHPNVIPVYGAGEEDGLLYLVMRWVTGTDLRELLGREGRLGPGRAARIVAQVGAGLDAAHAAGLVHRDVKPANVLIAEGGHVYLSDFGITRVVDAETRVTDSGEWVGTVDFMAPEHLEGRPTDARSDVYALACVLYTALTGTPPFRRDTVAATLTAHLHEPPPRVSRAAPGLPPELDRVLWRALAKRPEDRYPSAGDLGRAALAAAAGEHVTEEERTVATGAAAPNAVTTAMPTELLRVGAEAAPTGTVRGPEAPPERAWHPPANAPALKRHRAFLPRRGALGLLFVAALSASVAAVMVVRSSPDATGSQLSG
ncbi:MAG TPA: serine/threonine-protein kinase, partial [Solirubrobacteraceae bacterium]|nr:serine/threonine-protein kinase [Solirubrobacteraceae bacterium]